VTRQASSVGSRVRESAQLVLLGVVAAGVASGLVVWAVGWPEEGAVWAAVTVPVLLTELVGATLAPAAGALANELFPTSVRASVAGWLVAASVLGAAARLRRHRACREPLRSGRGGDLPACSGGDRTVRARA
jgi:hypothetical protein